MEAEINDNGWTAHNIWSHSARVRDLYTRRARDEAEEMTCAAQAVELIGESAVTGDSLLDMGCGSGYFYHSIRRRELPISYQGIDATPEFIQIGQQELPRFGLDKRCLKVMRIEDFSGWADHVLCMNVLSNLDNYHRPLERMLMAAQKSLVLRESIGEHSAYTYVRDDFLDTGVNLRVYVNTYGKEELKLFIESYGFHVRSVVDRWTAGEPELVIGYPHFWKFMVATRNQ